MKKNIAALFLLVVGLMCQAQPVNRNPNVVIILADDLGWTDLSCYGSTFYETPVLDKLAAEGIQFNQAYSACPVCSPTRASLMTGKYPVKTGVTDWIRGRQDGGKATPYEKLVARATAYQLALEENTLAELSSAQGYKTFFAGKWHLGDEEKFWPDHQGFEINKGGWSYGSPTGKRNDTTGGYFTPYANPRLKDGPPGEYLTDRLANECIDFIDQHREHPFLMMYSLYAVHNPLQAPTALVKKYEEKKMKLGLRPEDRFARDEAWMQNENGWRRRLVQDNSVYAAMIENMDSNIGRILEKLRQTGLLENTLIIFTSDNGGLSTSEGSPTVNGPLRAGKGWLYEGGIRVPFIMYWKGKIRPGSVSELPVCTIDIFPTAGKAIDPHYKADKPIDGKDILGMLQDPGKYANREIYWHYPHYSNQGGKPGSAIRKGEYKLVYYFEDNSAELFNLALDTGEKNNIAASRPALVRKLSNRLKKWWNETGASFPEPNPSYNPLNKSGSKGQDE
ncbi:MAG: sulfatase [Chitinophagaceae bacterium]